MPFPNFSSIYSWFTDNSSGNQWRVPFLDRANMIRPDSGQVPVPCNVAVLSFPILDLDIANGAIVSVKPVLQTGLNAVSGNYYVFQPDLPGTDGVVSIQADQANGNQFHVSAGGSGYVTGYAMLNGGYPVYIGVNSQINKDLDKVALPNLTTGEAGANGDVRKVYFAIIDQLAQAYLDKVSTNRPAKMAVTKSISVAPATGILTTTYNFQFQLYSTGLEVVNE